jgi:hypothetical protein
MIYSGICGFTVLFCVLCVVFCRELKNVRYIFNNTGKLKLYALKIKSTLYLEWVLLFGPEYFCILFYTKCTRGKMYGAVILPCFYIKLELDLSH